MTKDEEIKQLKEKILSMNLELINHKEKQVRQLEIIDRIVGGVYDLHETFQDLPATDFVARIDHLTKMVSYCNLTEAQAKKLGESGSELLQIERMILDGLQETA